MDPARQDLSRAGAHPRSRGRAVFQRGRGRAAPPPQKRDDPKRTVQLEQLLELCNTRHERSHARARARARALPAGGAGASLAPHALRVAGSCK